jgi:acyl-CoA thioester hydrolase
MYAHLNNSVYAFLFDSIINTYLITHCGLDPYNNNSSSGSSSGSGDNETNNSQSQSQSDYSKSKSSQIGLVVSSYCDYFASVSFPDVLDLGLRVIKLGSSSVTYEVGVFRRGEESVKAVGGFTHVFVPKDSNVRSSTGKKKGMDERIRKGLERLLVVEDESSNKKSSKL